MKNTEEVFEVTSIESKYAVLNGEEEKEKQVPKYKLPLEIGIGTKLVVNDFGMYQIHASNT